MNDGVAAERPGRIKVLDGFRAVSISVVILAHARGCPGFPAGLALPISLGGCRSASVFRAERLSDHSSVAFRRV